MFEEETSGVEQVLPAAGVEDSEEMDYSKLLFSDDEEETGVEGESAADSELPEDASKAFAKKLTVEREKMEKEIRAELTAEIQKQPTEQVTDGPARYKPLSGQELEDLAEKLGATPELVSIIYNQEQMNRQMFDDMRKRDKRDLERNEYNQAVTYAKELKEKHPDVPNWDDGAIHKYRMQFYRNYNRTIPWKEAYRAIIADTVLSGDMKRNTEQDLLRKITERDTANVSITKPQQKKVGVWDLPPSQFAEFKKQALEGKFKKS